VRCAGEGHDEVSGSTDVFNYIEMFYSPKRRHSPASGLSPSDFEQRHSQRLTGVQEIRGDSVKHADIVSFTCLKAFAFDQRFERKDAHDFAYCIEHAPEGLDAVVAAFARALAGQHAAVVREALDILRPPWHADAASRGSARVA